MAEFIFREEASWVVRELMDCPEKIEEYEKKVREYRYRKRAFNIGENWQTDDFSSLAQTGLAWIVSFGGTYGQYNEI